jgi:hypothetical protein
MLANVPSDDLSRILRWVDAGGEWRVAHLATGAADIELVTCTATR